MTSAAALTFLHSPDPVFAIVIGLRDLRVLRASKIQLRTELHEPWIQHARWLPEQRKRRIFRQHRVGIQSVEQIHIQRGSQAAYSQNLSNPEIELIQAIAVLGCGRDHIDDRSGASNERSAERGCQRRRRVDDGGLDVQGRQ